MAVKQSLILFGMFANADLIAVFTSLEEGTP
jgi:hypothetical protein